MPSGDERFILAVRQDIRRRLRVRQVLDAIRAGASSQPFLR
jgi:hypothetical protein